MSLEMGLLYGEQIPIEYNDPNWKAAMKTEFERFVEQNILHDRSNRIMFLDQRDYILKCLHRFNLFQYNPSHLQAVDPWIKLVNGNAAQLLGLVDPSKAKTPGNVEQTSSVERIRKAPLAPRDCQPTPNYLTHMLSFPSLLLT